MWTRQELKANAKVLIKPNYWKVVGGAIVAMLATNTGVAAVSNSAQKGTDNLEGQLNALAPEAAAAVIAALLGVIAVAGLVSLLLQIFVYSQLEVGAQRLFINCKDGAADWGDLVYVFKNGYGNVLVTMFLRNLFIFLWSLLFLVPGLIKSYEYKMVPYLLAEDPTMSRQEAFFQSKTMMMGNKWNAFVLDLSFIGWHLLAVVTCGLAEVFYIGPYVYLTNAELYHTLKNQQG